MGILSWMFSFGVLFFSGCLGPRGRAVAPNEGAPSEGAPVKGSTDKGSTESVLPDASSDAPRPLPWRELLPIEGLSPFRLTAFGGEGEVRLGREGWTLGFGQPLTGVHLERLPDEGAMREGTYEVECRVERLAGNDFFCGLTLPVGEGHGTVILGGWGGALCGFSCIDGADAARNESRSFRAFESGRIYRLVARVSPREVVAHLDGELLFRVARAGRAFEVRPEVAPGRPFGFACFQTEVRLHSLRWRPVTAEDRRVDSRAVDPVKADPQHLVEPTTGALSPPGPR